MNPAATMSPMNAMTSGSAVSMVTSGGAAKYVYGAKRKIHVPWVETASSL